MYEKYLLQLEEAGKIRNLKERSIDCYKNYVSYFLNYTSIQFFPQKQIPQQSMRLCILCCGQVQSFLCKFFRYRSPRCMFLS